MARCLNCGYFLVLRFKGIKYQCAKCSSLFLKKEIDLRDFRIWCANQNRLDKLSLRKPLLTTEQLRVKKEEQKIKTHFLEGLKWISGEKAKRDKEHYNLDINHSRLIRRIRYYRFQQKLLLLNELENAGLRDKLINSFSTFSL